MLSRQQSARRLAQSGNMRDIQDWADAVAALDPRFASLTDKVGHLARNFQSKAIAALAAQYRSRPTADDRHAL